MEGEGKKKKGGKNGMVEFIYFTYILFILVRKKRRHRQSGKYPSAASRRFHPRYGLGANAMDTENGFA